MSIPGGSALSGDPVAGVIAAAVLEGTIGEVARRAQSALIGRKRLVGVATQTFDKNYSSITAIGREIFRGPAILLSRRASQSASGQTQPRSGTVAQAARRTTSALLGHSHFIGASAETQRRFTQLIFAETGTSLAGGISQAARRATETAAGTLHFNATMTPRSRRALEALLGTAMLFGTAAQIARRTTSSGTGRERYSGAAVLLNRRARQQIFGGAPARVGSLAQASGRASIAATGFWLVLGNRISQSSRLALQQIAGVEIHRGNIVEVSPRATQRVLAVLPQLLAIERIRGNVLLQVAIGGRAQIRGS